MIKFNNVTFGYGKKKIFENFNFHIKDGEKISLFGESGCGKTTLLRLILGLEKAQKGQIIKKEGLKASVVFQENRLLPFKTVLQNITMFSDEETAIYHLNALGLSDYKNAYPDDLSGGMKRRVAIARALSIDFDFLILDEPFTGLDTENIKLATEHILKTAKDKTIILVTHSPYEIELLGAEIRTL
ncbi:MAG: ABC transporter ATP-binding protein [Clostridia bacterium]|nr:ABC transporter ATP-binding protein [Clostridia bacterium]